MADAKIINYGQPIGAGSTAIPDNNVSALDIESTEAKDFISISTAEGDESVRMVKTEHFAYGDTLTDTPKMTVTPQPGQILFDTTASSGTDFAFRPNAAETVRFIAEGGAKIIGIGGASGDLAPPTGAATSTLVLDSGSANSADRTALYMNSSETNGSIIDMYQGGNRRLLIQASATQQKIEAEDTLVFTSDPSATTRASISATNFNIQDLATIHAKNSADANGASYEFRKSRHDGDGSHTVLEDNDVLGSIKFSGSNGAAYVDGASIFARVNGSLASAASISSISVAGAGYTATGGGSASATSAATGVGSGMTVSITVGGSGEITGATVVATGKRYVTGDTVTVTGGSSAATLVVAADTSDMPAELVFATSTDSGGTPLEHIVITNSGKVGIGDPYPSVKLHVNVNSSSACGAFYNTSTSAMGSGVDGSQAAVFDNKVGPTIKLTNSMHEDSDGGRECGIAFQGEKANAGEIHTLGLMQFSHDGTGDDEKGKLTISVNDGDDGHVPSVTAMTILSDGAVQIGPSGVSDTSYLNLGHTDFSDVRIAPKSGGSATFYIKQKGSATGEFYQFYMSSGTLAMQLNGAGVLKLPQLGGGSDVETDANSQLITSSDSRLKTATGLIENGLEKILALTPRYFTWNNDESSTSRLGFFSQEVNAVCPEAGPKSPKLEAVGFTNPDDEDSAAIFEQATDDDGNPDFIWGLNSRALVALLVKSVQELSAKVTALEEAQGN